MKRELYLHNDFWIMETIGRCIVGVMSLYGLQIALQINNIQREFTVGLMGFIVIIWVALPIINTFYRTRNKIKELNRSEGE